MKTFRDLIIEYYIYIPEPGIIFECKELERAY